MRRFIRQTVISLGSAALVAFAGTATATTIAVGGFTPTTTPFIVPVIVSGAVELASFEFDLFYDPTQYRINTSCDPFGSDAYCDFVTGPVTPGTFYTSTASFPPLFNPGFILLDGSGTQQTGQLLGVEGAWQDPGPAPSGNGVLAYIEFVALVAQPMSPIVVRDPGAVSPPATVPEPSTCALLFAGLLLFTRRAVHRAVGFPIAR